MFEITIKVDEEHAEELIQLGKRIIEDVQERYRPQISLLLFFKISYGKSFPTRLQLEHSAATLNEENNREA